jgi:tetratricopeptide (TPR) repeat protein
VLLAEEEAPTVEKAVEYYRKGVEAGERALGKEDFERYVGHFWGALETRPYMRARMGLANMLWKLQRFDEAVAQYRELLRLNPGHNQGVRYVLLDLLMYLERDAAAGELLAKYEDESSAAWLYSRALLEFRRGGASAPAAASLREALRENKHVPNHLTGEKRIPPALPQMIGFGDESEAVAYAVDHLNFWRRTAGAVEWLKPLQGARGAAAKKRTSRRGGARAK